MKTLLIISVIWIGMLTASTLFYLHQYDTLTNQLNETRKVILGYVADRDTLQRKLLSCYENQHNNIKDTIIVSYRK